MSRRRFRIGAIVLLTALGACISCANATEFVVKTAMVPDMKAVFGQVESYNILPARARIGGSVREIRVTEGTEVKEGEIIARVVDDKLALELDAADAKIKGLKSQLDNARIELDRAKQLVSRGVASQSRLDQAQTQFDVATNQVAAAEADKTVIEQSAREGEVLAPANGRVLKVPVTLGSVVLAGDSLASIASGAYYLRLSLPERHATDIKEGGTVLIGERGLALADAGAIAAARSGRVVKVYPEISDGRVIADVDVSGIGNYFVNERTAVWIPVAKRPVISVPPEAVVTRHGIDYIRLLTTSGPLDVAVIVGAPFQSADGPRIEVLTGLKDGDRIAVPGSLQ
ncbi:MAG: efflux RND transporter periplasmic adaptor subunit [Proteobacteria bacterium]|nr:efflux RND transporter periplasmic adaptor subunit [Pseudomonadota bacterium]